jgi:hypothetical protein
MFMDNCIFFRMVTVLSCGTGSVMLAALISVPLTLLIAVCLACRKCRKRGKGEHQEKEKYLGSKRKGEKNEEIRNCLKILKIRPVYI